MVVMVVMVVMVLGVGSERGVQSMYYTLVSLSEPRTDESTVCMCVYYLYFSHKYNYTFPNSLTYKNWFHMSQYLVVFTFRMSCHWVLI